RPTAWTVALPLPLPRQWRVAHVDVQPVAAFHGVRAGRAGRDHRPRGLALITNWNAEPAERAEGAFSLCVFCGFCVDRRHIASHRALPQRTAAEERPDPL